MSKATSRRYTEGNKARVEQIDSEHRVYSVLVSQLLGLALDVRPVVF